MQNTTGQNIIVLQPVYPVNGGAKPWMGINVGLFVFSFIEKSLNVDSLIFLHHMEE